MWRQHDRAATIAAGIAVLNHRQALLERSLAATPEGSRRAVVLGREIERVRDMRQRLEADDACALLTTMREGLRA